MNTLKLFTKENLHFQLQRFHNTVILVRHTHINVKVRRKITRIRLFFVLLTCTDKYLNLDTLLIQIGSHITSKWYEFGQAAEIVNELLDKFLGYPSEQCIVEVLDYWLRNGRENKRTWKDVAEILKAMGEKSLADDILNVYRTGECMI